MPEADGGEDAGGEDAGLVTTDAGRDAGVVVSDGGRPPRVVFGSMTVNGTPYELWSGYGTRSPRTHQLRLGTDDFVEPRVQVTLVVPADAGVGFSAACGGPQSVLFSTQFIRDGGTAFFTLNQQCQVALSKVAADAGDDYEGTFSGSVDLDPRSVLDAGFSTMSITNGTFRVHRTF